MYTTTDFKTKKQLKEAVEKYNRYQELKKAGVMTVGDVMAQTEFQTLPREVRIYQPNQMFEMKETEPDYTGIAYCEGPHYPKPHTWYAQVVVEGGIIKKVK